MKTFLLITSFLVFVSCSCRKERQTYIWFNNTTNKGYYIEPSYTYPDTSYFALVGGYEIRPNTKESLGSKNGWDIDIINNNSTKTLMLFLLDKDTLGKYSGQEIPLSSITKRFDLSLDYLKKINWSITYP